MWRPAADLQLPANLVGFPCQSLIQRDIETIMLGGLKL
jgi:hypothetical protein